jgi:phage tail-like protein
MERSPWEFHRSSWCELHPLQILSQLPTVAFSRGVQSTLESRLQLAAWPPANFRKDINLELYNEAGQLVVSYKIFRSWVSSYSAPNLSTDGNAVAIEHIHLENEGILIAAAHKSSR